jgi:hypothetical protein
MNSNGIKYIFPLNKRFMEGSLVKEGYSRLELYVEPSNNWKTGHHILVMLMFLQSGANEHY